MRERQSAEGMSILRDINMLNSALPKIYALAESMKPLKEQIMGAQSEITRMTVLLKMMTEEERNSARGQELQTKLKTLQQYLKEIL